MILRNVNVLWSGRVVGEVEGQPFYFNGASIVSCWSTSESQ